MIDINDEKALDITNSEVIKRTLISLIIVARSKTSDDYAWASIKKLLGELKDKYSFLRFIKIKDISIINYSIEDINVFLILIKLNQNMWEWQYKI